MTNLLFVFLPSLLLLSANFVAFPQLDLGFPLLFLFIFFFVSMRAGGFYCNGFGEQNSEPHFLEACFLCRKSLGHNTDIFMYRGNTPFCSKECRQEQIEMEEAKEKNWRSSPTSTKAPRKSASNKKTVRTGTVAVA